MNTRGSAAIVGVAAMLTATVVLAGAVAATGSSLHVLPTNSCSVTGAGVSSPDAVALSVQLRGPRIQLTHEAGPKVNVSTVRMMILINRTPLQFQPPIPYFAARGFRSGPFGPFNSASDGMWEPGETASLEIAQTNTPHPVVGATLSVELRQQACVIGSVSADVQPS